MRQEQQKVRIQESGGQGSVKKVSGVRAQETGKKGIDPKIVEKARKKGYR